MQIGQADHQRGVQNIEGVAVGFALHLAVDKRQHLRRRRLRQQVAQAGGDFRPAVQRIVFFIGAEQRASGGHENLQRGLLTQGGKPVHAPFVAEQPVHQRRGGVHAGGFERLLHGGQDKLLDGVQQDIVAGDFKALAEQQARVDFDVVAHAIVERIVRDR